jgi:CDP-glucose 4,6-dehydratase
MKSQKDVLFETYQGSTVLITGHTGFKGGWLTLWLESLGANVVGYSLDPPTNPSFFDITCLSERVIDERGNILDKKRVFELIKQHEPEFIFHLAAQPLVRYSYNEPLHTFDVNVIGTANLLESIRLSKINTTCVCITSDKCYENREWDYSYRENDSLGGHDPYSASKAAAEIVISSYRKSFFDFKGLDTRCALSSARAGNIIGGGDWAADRIVPDCIRSLIENKTIEVRNPAAVRPWQFVLDPLFGYLWLAHKMKENPEEYSDAWNFGPNYCNNINVKTLTEKIIQDWGFGRWESIAPNMLLHEAGFLKLDITKSVTKLGWEPVYDIDQAIRRTVEWYKTNNDGIENMYKFSVSQLEKYMGLLNKQK